MTDWSRAVPMDMGKMHVADTARATRESAQEAKESRELIQQMVEHAIVTAEAAEVRERQMLRWTQAGVVLAGIAAVASLIAIVVTVVVGG
jgi:hypothetical protein